VSKKAFSEIAAGLEDALLYAQGDRKRGLARQVKIEDIDVAGIRRKLGLSQQKFANAFGISVATLRGWEQGQRRPTGPARTLLTFINREPEAALRALSDA